MKHFVGDIYIGIDEDDPAGEPFCGPADFGAGVPALGLFDQTREAKISGYTWHSNRHTFCSWLAMAGPSMKDIQTLTGHKTITMASRFAHLSPDAAAAASESIVADVNDEANMHQNRYHSQIIRRNGIRDSNVNART